MRVRREHGGGTMRRAVGLLLAAGAVPLVLLSVAHRSRAEGIPPSPETCRSSIVYYYPDSIGREHAEIAGRIVKVVEGPLSAALGKHLTGYYFSRRKDLVAQIAHCQRLGAFPVGGMMHAETALEYRNLWHLEVLGYSVALSTGAKQTINVAVRRGSGLRRLQDLRGRTLLTPEFWDVKSPRPTTIVFAGALSLADFAEVNETPSSISALTGLAFRQADAILVSNRVFEVFKERSPKLWATIQSIHESQPIPLNLLVGFGALSAREREVLEKTWEIINTSSEGREALEYLRIDHMAAGGWSDVYDEDDLATSAKGIDEGHL
ncbi:MAG: PhnD/SsuA/transferrin family substrate-binding protein [Candidatus Schekmanbacteria bacterium]|nr:PhnD/SsuA/transferrin family substrate-binding protein [Candidatus Schekmanbacteria bacterium]